MKLFKDRLFTVYFLAILVMVLFAITQTALADTDPRPREIPVELILDPVTQVVDTNGSGHFIQIDNVILEDVLKLLSHLPFFQQLISYMTIALAVLAILNYIALLTPFKWDDALLGPLSSLFRRIYFILRGWRR